MELENLLLNSMREYFGKDLKRIRHAEKVLAFAKEIQRFEGGDKFIIFPTAIFHDIGIHECERKYNSTAGNLQEIESPPIAREILSNFSAYLNNLQIEEICEIIAHHHSPGFSDSLNFQIMWDADWLVNFNDELNLTDNLQREKMIAKIFTTFTGKEIARSLYLN